jgi:LmbE family N-acetylglucosaminyl deacetylase
MLSLLLGEPTDRPLEVLCLGAHCDDIEIGAGGTVLRLVESFPRARFTWLVAASTAVRREEAHRSAAAFLAGAASVDVRVEDFRESYLPAQAERLKDRFEELKASVSPDLILTHHRHDRHQDHRLVAELTWNTFRDHLVLEYEIAKYEGDLGTPNLYVALDDEVAARKADLIVEHFPSQQHRHWFERDAFLALSRVRGIEANTRHAEAFHAPKVMAQLA